MNFTVQNRENTGKGSNRKLRAKGLVPGIIYGQGEPQLVSMREDQGVRFLLSMGRVKQLVELTVEKDGQTETKQVVVQDYQASNFGNRLLHVDFMEVLDTTEVTANVPIQPTTNSKGVKQGGVMQVIRRTVPVRCKASAIPQAFAIDAEAMDVGDTFHVLDIDYPEGVTPIVGERNFTILTITGRKADEEEEAAEGEAETETAAAAAAE